jgi:crotonobetaine/carnitine-CoA ligase
VTEATLRGLLDRLSGRADGSGLTFEAADGTTASLGYTELVDASRSVAAGLVARGVEFGDRVVVHLPNCLDTVVIWCALGRLGALFVPTSTALTAREVAFIAARCEPTLAIGRPEAGDLLAEAGLAPESTLLIEGYEELAGDSAAAAERKPQPEDPVELIFTSGTTSSPKAAVITHANCAYSGRQKAEAMRVGSDDCLLTALPIIHVNAQSALLAAMTAGASFTLLERYSASRYCEQLAAYRATLTSLVGTQVRTLLRQEPSAADRAHAVNRAWFALNVADEERAAFEERFGMRLINGYGLTEAFTSVTQTPLEGPDRWPSVGTPVPGRTVSIVDGRGEQVPPGTVGEIVVGGEPGRTIMAGYWRDPEATAQALRDDGLHTGDLGRLDAAGYLFFVERKAHMIKRAGENVAAGEVERILLEHPEVAEAAVVGVPDPIRDEAVKAFVVPEPSTKPTIDELAAHCAERLAPFKVPTLWSLQPELPRNALGKVEYRRLLEHAPAEHAQVVR